MAAAPQTRAAERFPALILDLDGTLLDSAPDLAAALNRVLAEAGRATLAETRVRGMIGSGSRRLVERGFAATGGPPDDLDAALARFLAIYEAAAAHRSRLYDGVAATLDRLAADGHRLALATNKPVHATRTVLAAFGLTAYFADELVIGGGSLAALKPDPAPVTELLRRLGIATGAAVVVGDSAHDVDAAAAAGARSVAVTYGYGETPAAGLGADAVIETFRELPSALDALARAAA